MATTGPFHRLLATILVVYALVLGALAPAANAASASHDPFTVLCSEIGHGKDAPADDGRPGHGDLCCVICTAAAAAPPVAAPTLPGRVAPHSPAATGGEAPLSVASRSARSPLQPRAPPAAA